MCEWKSHSSNSSEVVLGFETEIRDGDGKQRKQLHLNRTSESRSWKHSHPSLLRPSITPALNSSARFDVRKVFESWVESSCNSVCPSGQSGARFSINEASMKRRRHPTFDVAKIKGLALQILDYAMFGIKCEMLHRTRFRCKRWFRSNWRKFIKCG